MTDMLTTHRTEELPAFLDSFAAIHDSMRRDSAGLANALAGVDTERSLRDLRRWYDRFAHAIEAHHHREDDLVWPDLMRRSPEFAEELDRLESDHAALDVALTDVHAALAANPFDSHHAVDCALRLATLLTDHLAREEVAAFPRIAASYSAEEYAELEERMMEDMSIADLAFDLPWVLEAMTTKRQLEVVADLPLAVRWINRLVFAPRYRALSSPIRDARRSDAR